MLTNETRQSYLAILESELVPALGCTEPIAVAFAAASARKLLGRFPERLEVWCSGNIIKNVKGVTVPNTGGLKGVDAAAIAGVVGGDPELELRALESLGPAEQRATRELLAAGFSRTFLVEGVENLYIEVKAFAGHESAEVLVKDAHTAIARLVRNGETLLDRSDKTACPSCPGCDRSGLNLRDILAFVEGVEVSELEGTIGRQIVLNTAIADEGLARPYGVEVGRTLLKRYGDDLRTRARARAAAGSDARMSGCALPVVINSGSGNQGMTISLPVIEYARELGAGKERLYRALALANLLAVHQKRYIGRLSAYCGAVSAAASAGAAITWLCGGDYAAVARTVTNTIANIGGMVCDGAKPSCAAKIASALDAAIFAHELSAEGKVFGEGEGLVKGDVEATIASVGRMGGAGMRGTDLEILKLMIAP